ncbi:MAG TPA: AraC family transcriptional regulator [Dinghuibacter sp.]|jgi:AraC-like DNA-binding protein|uniref:AraC family transcriptional regulator n=1 Tax=Dinghuibacter sp. TaxID=2024697 RepID=UPI002C9217EF|nr:AraC family transcriptional regulator [Dinghuibacter sp.]HTJ10601.1 AraC family transcriptional regulator [Dinghuibacter sp.]
MKVVQFTIPVAGEYSVIVQEDVQHWFYEHLHRHPETQITWIIKGEGTLIAGNYMQRFKPGDIYVLGANQPHVFKSDPSYFDKRKKKDVHSISIFFNPKGFFKSILELPEMKTVAKFVDSTNYGIQAHYLHQDILSEAIQDVKTKTGAGRLSAFIDMLQFMAGLKKWKTLSTEITEHAISDTEGLRMNDIYQYTMSNYTENITLKRISDVAHLTPQAFCRYFKKHTLKTYVNFLNEVRVSEACKKLMARDYESVSAVAYQTGFSNAVTFNRVFKKVTGKSPRQYGKEYAQNVEY